MGFALLGGIAWASWRLRAGQGLQPGSLSLLDTLSRANGAVGGGGVSTLDAGRWTLDAGRRERGGQRETDTGETLVERAGGQAPLYSTV